VGLPHAIGAARFGVSAELMQWRTDHSGASHQARAAARLSDRTIPRLPKPDTAALLNQCDLAWLGDLNETDWQSLLRSCGHALAKGSVDDLARCLQQPLATR
jgi:hypothetical protein